MALVGGISHYVLEMKAIALYGCDRQQIHRDLRRCHQWVENTLVPLSRSTTVIAEMPRGLISRAQQ